MDSEPESTTYEARRSETEVVRHFPDIWYSVRAWAHEYTVEFEVFEITSQDHGKAITWGERDASYGPTFCEDMDKSERMLTGFVKWDGCSNWDFEADTGMKHFCDKEQAMRIGTVLGHCYDLAAELCSKWMD